MARQTGSTSTVRIPLNELVAKLQSYPNLPIAVGKGWLKNTSEALAIDFSAESAVAAETAATEERPTAQVD